MKQNIKQKIKKLHEKGLRLDGRKIDEFREIEFIDNISMKAEGSTHVKLGKTEVFVGVKIGLGAPYDDTPEQGNLMVNAEITPASAKEHEPGPPNEEVIALARVVDRGIRESHSIDLKSLMIVKGERVFELFIDAYVMNDDGNLVDACAMGALRALKNSVIPTYDKKTDSIDYKTKSTKKLKINQEPISITVAKIENDLLLVDPTKSELENSGTKIVITLNEKDRVVSLQKQGGKGFKSTELKECFKLATKHSKNVRKQVNK